MRLLDLSLTGAQIEHLDPLQPGVACTLDLPPPGGALTLPAQVVWCTVIGRKRKVGGASHLVARSGLRFTTLTAAQQTALAETLHDLATALRPITCGTWPDPADAFEPWLLGRVAEPLKATRCRPTC